MSFKGILDWIMDALFTIVQLAIGWLPVSPFQSINWSKDAWAFKVLGWVNYFIPIGTILGIMTGYLGAVMVWYGVRWILRFAKYID